MSVNVKCLENKILLEKDLKKVDITSKLTNNTRQQQNKQPIMVSLDFCFH